MGRFCAEHGGLSAVVGVLAENSIVGGGGVRAVVDRKADSFHNEVVYVRHDM